MEDTNEDMVRKSQEIVDAKKLMEMFMLNNLNGQKVPLEKQQKAIKKTE